MISDGRVDTPILDFQTIMLPLLRVIADGQEHSIQDLLDRLAEIFSLSEEELRELLPSGKQPCFTIVSAGPERI